MNTKKLTLVLLALSCSFLWSQSVLAGTPTKLQQIVDFVKNHKNDRFCDCNCNCGGSNTNDGGNTGNGIGNGGGSASALSKICYECVSYNEKQPQKAGEHIKLCHQRACQNSDPMTGQKLSNGKSFLSVSPNMLDIKFLGNINQIICREYDSKPRYFFLEPYKPFRILKIKNKEMLKKFKRLKVDQKKLKELQMNCKKLQETDLCCQEKIQNLCEELEQFGNTE